VFAGFLMWRRASSRRSLERFDPQFLVAYDEAVGYAE